MMVLSKRLGSEWVITIDWLYPAPVFYRNYLQHFLFWIEQVVVWGLSSNRNCLLSVDRKISRCEQIPANSSHRSEASLQRVQLWEERGSQSNGPIMKYSSSSRQTLPPHWIYFLWSGVILGRKRIRSPKTMSLDTESREKRYQFGHHRPESSHFEILDRYFARKLQ